MSIPFAIAATVIGAGAIAYYLQCTSFKESSNMTSHQAPKSSANAKPCFSGFGFQNLKLQSAELVNHDTKRLRFEFPGGASQPSGLSLTSAVLTFSFPNNGWIPCVRPYTPVNRLNEPGYLELLVKHYPNGKQSGHLHSLKPGDTLKMASPPPLPRFPYKSNMHAHMAMIAGGAGITPMWQLTQGILNNPDDNTKITLLWGVSSDQDLFLRDNFAALEKLHPGRFRAVYTVSKPDAGSTLRKGFVTREFLEEEGLDAKSNQELKILVCGPPPMEKSLVGSKGLMGTAGVLSQMGYLKGQIYRF